MTTPGLHRRAGFLLALGLFLRPAAASATAQDERPRHLSPEERQAVSQAMTRGASWLISVQADSGAFPPRIRADTCPVALTSMALWAVSRVDAQQVPEPAVRAARYLLEFRQSDGGLYDPTRGLAVYTSGVAAQALSAFHARHATENARAAAYDAELFAYRRGVPESIVDDRDETGTARDRSANQAREILVSDDTLPGNERDALQFLAGFEGQELRRAPLRTRNPRWDRPGPQLEGFSYEDLLPFVYRPLRREHQMALRAAGAIRAHYTLDRNPDLTRRFGEGGFQRERDGLFYYYLLVARALSLQSRPVIELSDGSTRDWVRELSGRLLDSQADDGHWVNDSSGWWEDEPVLVTSYAVLALALCRDVGARR